MRRGVGYQVRYRRANRWLGSWYPLDLFVSYRVRGKARKGRTWIRIRRRIPTVKILPSQALLQHKFLDGPILLADFIRPGDITLQVRRDTLQIAETVFA